MTVLRRLAVAAAAGLALARPAGAQQRYDPMARAFDLERRGSYAEAASAYREALLRSPGDPAALLGLERVLVPLGRSAEVVADARAASAANPASAAVQAVLMRAWAAAAEPESTRVAAERWAALAPEDDAPYREWGGAALAQGDRAAARAAYLAGRDRLGRADALAAELAQLAAAEGDYAVAVREWTAAVRRLPGYRPTAVATLSRAPEASRATLLARLAAAGDPVARRLEADLRARWGDPLGGLRVLESALPANRVQAIEALRSYVDQLRPMTGREARLAQARGLEAIAVRSPAVTAARLRLEAARAYSEAGDRAGARRMLAGLADGSEPPVGVAMDARTALLDVLIADGKLDEAGRRLADLRPELPTGEYSGFRRRLALAWARASDLGRADSLVASDSTVDGLALAGRLRLFRGDVAAAVNLWRAAGPYAGDRGDATSRTALLSVLQALGPRPLPALGEAFLRLERGDTAAAVAGLEAVAGAVEPSRGGAELELLAGRLARAAGRAADAERLFRAASATPAAAAAPAAELALGELLIAEGRGREAIAVLEHLILSYPQSALVPQARRALDEARGSVPRT